MPAPLHPVLFQVNTRVWLTELARSLGRPATLDDIPDEALDQFRRRGFDWIWLLSVWQTGRAARDVSRSQASWRHEFQETLADLTDTDIGGSGFAIQNYTVHQDLGGDAALARLRERLHARDLKLMLDFVPNHMAPDHPWVDEHLDFFVAGTERQLTLEPRNYCQVATVGGTHVLAHGRDPYFDGWPDTLQLNYGNPRLQDAMIGELCRIAGQCDGVRCDMAMLLLPDVFQRTWGIEAAPFWPEATRRVRQLFPEFCFLAEVYWDLEWTLQQQGFDYTYDKRLYDRLRQLHARPVRDHLRADLDYQRHSARFLENHDEPRAAATFPDDVHRAAAVISFLAPGMRFIHQGQLEGRKKRISPHLIRGPVEPIQIELAQFYEQLLTVLRDPTVHRGQWRLLDCQSAWEGNDSWENFVVYSWETSEEERILAAVNYSPNQSQCFARIPSANLINATWRLEDALSDDTYDRDGADLAARGLYLDMRPWQAAIYCWHRAT